VELKNRDSAIFLLMVIPLDVDFSTRNLVSEFYLWISQAHGGINFFFFIQP
jgi:hypothetical protein